MEIVNSARFSLCYCLLGQYGNKNKNLATFLIQPFWCIFWICFLPIFQFLQYYTQFFFFFSFFSEDFSSPIAGALQDYTAASFSKLLLCIAVEFEESIGNLFWRIYSFHKLYQFWITGFGKTETRRSVHFFSIFLHLEDNCLEKGASIAVVS